MVLKLVILLLVLLLLWYVDLHVWINTPNRLAY